MIVSFKGPIAEDIFRRHRVKRLDTGVQRMALRKLRMLHHAHTLADLRIPPGNRLEKLKGDRGGQYSVRINDRWRICFDWRNRNAHEVEIIDYH